MATEDDSPAQETELVTAAGAAAGGQTSSWARQGREAIQGSHCLTAPLARWTYEPLEPETAPADGAGAESETEMSIPEAVQHARPPQRMPEDTVCRSPIAGLVIAVLAAAGQEVTKGQPVLIIEAMKMLNHVTPAVDGVVKAVHAAPGDAVKAGQVLFELD